MSRLFSLLVLFCEAIKFITVSVSCITVLFGDFFSHAMQGLPQELLVYSPTNSTFACLLIFGRNKSEVQTEGVRFRQANILFVYNVMLHISWTCEKILSQMGQ
jgi:hypothetical protein